MCNKKIGKKVRLPDWLEFSILKKGLAQIINEKLGKKKV
jgi:hypothetical protein